jgi:hypothetical protein
MCGNALRCAAKLVWERRGQLLPDWLWAAKNEDGKNDRNVLYIETPAGTHTHTRHTRYRTRAEIPHTAQRHAYKFACRNNGGSPDCHRRRRSRHGHPGRHGQARLCPECRAVHPALRRHRLAAEQGHGRPPCPRGRLRLRGGHLPVFVADRWGAYRVWAKWSVSLFAA